MTTPAPQDITLTRGDSWDMLFRVKGKDALGDLIYLDLTGCVATSQIRENEDAAAVVATITCTLTDQVTLPGGVLLRLEDTDTAAIIVDSAMWDVEIKWPGVNGDRKTVLSGLVSMTKDITRA